MWNPEQYARYSDERSRPFYDLLAQVRAEAPRHIADLGCGSGQLTATLLERWPGAQVTGVDSSPEMLAQAATLARPGQLDFVQADLQTWTSARPLDLLVSNAAIQWVPDHAALLPHLAAQIAPGGWLAVQLPGNFDAPSHVILNELRQDPRWSGKLAAGRGAAEGATLLSQTPGWYLERLHDLGFRVNAWETTYLHLLGGPDPVLAWVRGTALRPVLAVLDEGERAEFEAEYGARLRAAYPAGPAGTLLPFRRVFFVARRA